VAVEAAHVPWSVAWQRAAYGARGFYTTGEAALLGPAAFFRTSVHVGAVFHGAMAHLLLEVDARLGHPAVLDVIDVGAGRGELLEGILTALPDDMVTRLRACAVDVHDAPADLDPRITWISGAAPDAVPSHVRGLVVAHEWLDDIPLDVVALDERRRPRLVLVDAVGEERLGPGIDDDAAWSTWGLDAQRAREWVAQWWPTTGREPGERVEIGTTRDEAWRAVVAGLDAGTALAVDFGHVRASRPYRGTLVGHARGGRAHGPAPDSDGNLTAHVAVDAVATAAAARVTRQREALTALGVTSYLPDRAAVDRDPQAYAEALAAASDAAELLDPVGLGGFHWIRVDR
jgi:SAM-dependent MidA family methyltransferase